MSELPVLITYAEIAEVLGYSKDFVLGALRRGEIPARKVGARWIISRTQFYRWLDGDALASPTRQPKLFGEDPS